MRKTYLFIFLLILTCTIAWAADDKAIMANEEKLWSSIKAGDMKGFATMVAENAVDIEAAGMLNGRDQIVAHLSHLTLEDYKLSDWSVKWIDPDCAIVIYKAWSKGMMDNMEPKQTMEFTHWMSTVWHLKDGKWLAVLHQETAPMSMEGAEPAM